MKKVYLVILTTVFFSSLLFADGILMSWGMSDIKGMTKEKWDAARTWSVTEILQNNINAESWADAYLAVVGASQKKDSIIDKLVDQLDNASITKLKLTNRLIIWERILSDDIIFEGEGFQVNDDLFSVAGRANWILRNITKKNFGYIKPNSNGADLQALKNKWKQWREGRKIDEYVDPFESKEKGLDETHSLVAFEALIFSLKPSQKKDAITRDCLKRVYQLDEMPKEKGSSASYCNPDTYTFFFVSNLVGQKEIDESRDYAWWSKWWAENKQKLVWNKEKGIFDVSK